MVKNNKKINGVVYVRVSSEEQVSGTSLDHQEKECIKYCENKGIRIVKVFREEGASAKSAERKQFLRAVEYCRERKKRDGIDAFIVHKCDRFARNVEDHYFVRRKLLDYGTQLHSVTEPIDQSPQGKVFEAMLSAFAEFDNSIRRQRSMDGMSARINDGIYPWRPPLGYVNQCANKNGKKKDRPDMPDPDVFPIIQKGLKRFASGGYQKIALFRKDLDEWGLGAIRGKQTTSSMIYVILHKYLLFYAGIIHNPFTKRNVVGKHKPMITKDEYDKIRFYLDRRRVQPEKKTYFRQDFPLRQIIGCSECGQGLTASFSKGRKKRYAYYHCYRKNCSEYGKTISSSKMEKSFCKHLEQFRVSSDFWEVLAKGISRYYEREMGGFDNKKKMHKKNIDDINKKMARLKEGFIEGLFDGEYLKAKTADLENKLTKEKIDMEQSDFESVDFHALIKEAKRYALGMHNLWRELVSPESRLQFLGYISSGPILYHRTDGIWNHPKSEILNVYKGFSESGNDVSYFFKGAHFGKHRWEKIIENLRVFEKKGEENWPYVYEN